MARFLPHLEALTGEAAEAMRKVDCEMINSDYTPEDVRRLTDENEIRTLQARFDDTVIRRDLDGFRALWTPDAVWEIDPPLELHAQGIDAIMKALTAFNVMNEFMFRSTGYGVIALNGDQARSTVTTTEFGRRASGKVYNNVALYQDELARTGGRWRFTARRYYYLWVDTESPIPGQSVALPSLPAS